MAELKSFIIDFYSTYTNGAPVTTILIAPQLPSSTDVQSMIQELITFLQSNGITLSNYGLVSGGVNNIINAVKKLPSLSESIKTATDSVGSNSSNATSLITSLQSLLAELESEGASTTYTTPDMETEIGASSTTTGNLRARRPHGQSSVTKFKGLGAKVSEMQTNSTTTSTNYTNFINKVKSAVTSIVNGSASASTTTSTTSSTTNNTVSTSTNSSMTTTNLFNTSGTTSSGVPNNIINNIVRNFLSNRNFGGRINKTGGTTNNTSITDLLNFKAPAPETNPTQTSTVVETTDYYEVSSAVQSGLIYVTYSYFPANSQTSSFSCTFSLLPNSLISLSLSAYESSIRSSNEIKTTLCQNAGYAASASPTNSDMWNTYLIWLYSYLGTGVASQLGFGNIKPFPGPTTGSVNYMLNEDYMNKVGNFGLTIQTSTMDSDDAGLTSISIPDSWSMFMYNFGKNRRGGSSDRYMAMAVVSAMKSQTDTTST